LSNEARGTILGTR